MELINIYERESIQEWTKWSKKIPSLKFKEDWEVKVIPPFAGAIVRFVIIKEKASVSVYLDCYDQLGCFGEPYWEIYPAEDGDIFRIKMENSTELLKQIELSINKQLNNSEVTEK